MYHKKINFLRLLFLFLFLISDASLTSLPNGFAGSLKAQMPGLMQYGAAQQRTQVIRGQDETPQPKAYFIQADADSFQYIYDNYSEDIYIHVSVTYNGKTWPNVRLRLRGDTSRKYPKKSLKLKFDDQDFYNGRRTINLNAEYLDPSYIHNYLSSYLFNITGHACFNVEHIRVYLNGQFFGLYISVENMDEDFLNAHGLDSGGNLYKASKDNACLSLFDDLDAWWEKKTNENQNWDDLKELILQMNTVQAKEYKSFCETTLDYDKMINILALNMLIANGSTYYHNYYMFHDLLRDKWMMLPWDMDKTISKYGLNYSYQRSSNLGNHDNPFLERAIIDDQIFTDIQNRIDEITADYFNLTYLGPVIDSLVTLLAPSVAEDTTDNISDTLSWKSQIQTEKDFIAGRTNYLHNQFNAVPLPFASERTPDIFTNKITFRWHPSIDPNGDAVHYILRYSRYWNYPADNTVTFDDLTDTVFTLPALPEEGTYYWRVQSADGHNVTDGFDSKNNFTYKPATALPAEITSDFHMTASASPYLALQDVRVHSGAKLTAGAGVELRFGNKVNLFVNGGLQFKGYKENPVILRADLNVAHWGAICIDQALDSVVITNAEIREGRKGTDSLRYRATVSSILSDLRMDHVSIKSLMPVFADGGSVQVENSSLQVTGNYDGINIKHAKAVIKNTVFPGTPLTDPIDFDGVKNGLIEGCTIYNSGDDGIDIGEVTTQLVIRNNFIQNCSDKGISIGEKSDVEILHNIIASSHTGIAVKDSSYALIDHNTLYDNDVALSCYKKNDSYGPAKMLAENNILSQSTTKALSSDAHSVIQVRYSLSDTDNLTGEGNLFGDPLFAAAENGDFHLLKDSPAINAGDPSAPKDPDGTRSDMGALFFNMSAAGDLVINEINYHSAGSYDTGDWIELFNTKYHSINLNGWTLKDSQNDHIFEFRNRTLAARSYLVVCRDTAQFKDVVHHAMALTGDLGYGLSGSGDQVRLYNAQGKLVDSVAYDDHAPWPVEADGQGKTLELLSDQWDNVLAQNWRASQQTGGTPGQKNSVNTGLKDHKNMPGRFKLYQSYPNPFNAASAIVYDLPAAADVKIIIYDISGRMLRPIYAGRESAGSHTHIWRAAQFASGIYFYGVKVNGRLRGLGKCILIK